MLRSLMNFLTKAMPVLLLLFVILAGCQLFFLSPLLGQKFSLLYENFINYSRISFLPLALMSFFLVLVGCGYEISSNRLARLGLRRRRGFLVRLLDRFTRRQKLDETLTRTYQENRLDAGEFAASLRARVIGQDSVCEDIAQQVKLRLATRKKSRPVALFLFLGPAGTGKKFLARQIALQLGRPCFFLKYGTDNGQSLPLRLELTAKQNPHSVLVIQNCLSLSAQDWSQIFGLWQDHSGTSPSFCDIILIFTETTPATLPASSIMTESTAEERRITGNKTASEAHMPSELISQCDRIFLFQPLREENLARVSAMALEDMIRDYGLNVETGGIDPNLILPLIRQQQTLDMTPHEIVRLIEDQIGETLISLRQQGQSPIRLTSTEREGRICLVVQRSSPAQERLVPATVKG
ncbi:hypothetical protein PT277_02065 [Acetobacteraceae bacterium ESL0709]|nr:hypothetical protein [Acetobacteraceae bacterium ESL0697]MDF7677487.1 hypothetical protein [Acetobacteraceae bacterium ESL0709]